MIKPITIKEIPIKKQLLRIIKIKLDKRYREKSGKKYREFIKVLKKKSSKKEESQLDLDNDNPSSTFNTHLEENLFVNARKSEELNTNLSIRSTESNGDFKKEIESLIFYRVNAPASSTKNILCKLETMKKKVYENNDGRFNEVNIIISYRQLVNELVPFLKNFLNHNNNEISKKAHEIILMIKDKVFSMIFNKTDRVDELFFDFEIKKINFREIIKLVDNESICISPEKNINKKSNESSLLNDISSDAPQEFLVECLNKRDRKKPKLKILPFNNIQIFHLLKEYIQIDTSNCDDFIEKLNSKMITNTKNISVPDNKKLLRKNICIQLLNVFEKLVNKLLILDDQH